VRDFGVPHHHLLLRSDDSVRTFEASDRPLLRQYLHRLYQEGHRGIVIDCTTGDCLIYRPDHTGRLSEEDIHDRIARTCHARGGGQGGPPPEDP
jgi:hypothetical protein